MSEIKDFKEFPTRDDYFANVISENKYQALRAQLWVKFESSTR